MGLVLGAPVVQACTQSGPCTTAQLGPVVGRAANATPIMHASEMGVAETHLAPVVETAGAGPGVGGSRADDCSTSCKAWGLGMSWGLMELGVPAWVLRLVCLARTGRAGMTRTGLARAVLHGPSPMATGTCTWLGWSTTASTISSPLHLTQSAALFRLCQGLPCPACLLPPLQRLPDAAGEMPGPVSENTRSWTSGGECQPSGESCRVGGWVGTGLRPEWRRPRRRSRRR